MSKRSTVTARVQPVADVTSASGALHVHAETITIDTHERLAEGRWDLHEAACLHPQHRP